MAEKKELSWIDFPEDHSDSHKSWAELSEDQQDYYSDIAQVVPEVAPEVDQVVPTAYKFMKEKGVDDQFFADKWIPVYRSGEDYCICDIFRESQPWEFMKISGTFILWISSGSQKDDLIKKFKKVAGDAVIEVRHLGVGADAVSIMNDIYELGDPLGWH